MLALPLQLRNSLAERSVAESNTKRSRTLVLQLDIQAGTQTSDWILEPQYVEKQTNDYIRRLERDSDYAGYVKLGSL
jgi:hypothetical protein